MANGPQATKGRGSKGGRRSNELPAGRVSIRRGRGDGRQVPPDIPRRARARQHNHGRLAGDRRCASAAPVRDAALTGAAILRQDAEQQRTEAQASSGKAPPWSDATHGADNANDRVNHDRLRCCALVPVIIREAQPRRLHFLAWRSGLRRCVHLTGVSSVPLAYSLRRCSDARARPKARHLAWQGQPGASYATT